MALGRQELRQLAITGAQAKIKELDALRSALLREFPELNSSNARVPGGRGRGGRIRAEVARSRRRTRRFTAAQRRAISARMKRFWADRRKKNASKAA